MLQVALALVHGVSFLCGVEFYKATGRENALNERAFWLSTSVSADAKKTTAVSGGSQPPGRDVSSTMREHWAAVL